MNWTKEQKRIIDLRDSNVLVSAAAGSGKTAVLVERVIQLVRDQNEEIDSFLVVTFTNAAAAGMKQKIQKALVKAIKEGKNTRHLRRQLSQISKAQITTFHSYCLDVIKGHFNEVGLDPSFEIGDVNELESIYREVVDEVLEEAYKEDSKSFKTLVESFSSNRYDTEIFDLVDRVYKFIQSFPEPFKWLNSSVELLTTGNDGLDGSKWSQELFKHVRMQLNGARKMLQLAIRISEMPGGPEPYIDFLKEELVILENLIDSTKEGLEKFIEELYTMEFKRIPSVTAKRNPDVDLELKDKAKDLRDKEKAIVNSLKSIYFYEEISQYTDDMNHMYEPIRELKNLVQKVDKLYTTRKREVSLLDYNDLERYALEILTDQTGVEESSKGLSPSEIAMEFKNKFKYIFVDEYQDINGKQEAIIDQIKREDNLFMVGDVKQSIYRFRLADPSIFNYKYNTFEKDREDLSKDYINRVIELNKNFRSRKEILDSTNNIFSKIMSEEIGEVEYSENIYLNNGKTDFAKNQPVELNLINQNKETTKSDNSNDDENDDSENMEIIDDELKYLSQAEFEAIFAVKKVKELLNESTYEDSDEKLRRIEYKDIVILIRAVSSWASVFEEEFRKAGIPFYFDGGGGYFSAMEIQIVVNLLKLLDNINQDIPMLSVMRSPIGKFSTSELTEIRSRYKRGTYVEACRKYMEGFEVEGSLVELNESLQQKLENFFKFINKWIRKSRLIRTDDLIWKILMETRYYEIVGSMQNGKQRQANLRMLVDRANEYTEGTSRGLFDFLRYIEKISEEKEDKTSSAKTLGENDNVVRLMSIHNSKGLEFPVVILCGLNKGFNKTDTRNPILMHKDLGIGTKYVDYKERIKKDTFGRTAIAKKNEIEGLSEEMRILYVGMTRAIDRLIMVGTINNLEEKARSWVFGNEKYFLYKAKSFLDWIGLSLFKGLELEGLSKVIEKGNQDDFRLNMINTVDLVKGIKETQNHSLEEKLHEIKSFNNKEIYDEIDRRLSFTYPFKDSGKAPTKLSVTSLKHVSLDPKGTKHDVPILSEMLDYHGDASELDDGMKFVGTEIGTLVHLVLEHIDLKEDVSLESLEQQIIGFVESKMITEKQFEFIKEVYLDKIYGFLTSSIGTRMRRSTNIRKEAPFIIKKKAVEVFDNITGDDSIFVQGIIDCYFEEDGEIVIVDYKTDRLKGRTPEDLVDEYRVQINSYKEAIERTTKKKVKESYLYLFSVGEEVQVKE